MHSIYVQSFTSFKTMDENCTAKITMAEKQLRGKFVACGQEIKSIRDVGAWLVCSLVNKLTRLFFLYLFGYFYC